MITMKTHTPNFQIFLTRTILVLLTCFIYSISLADENQQSSQLKKGNFLIASDSIETGALAKSVIFITQHDTAGTSGFIVNRPTNLNINEAFPETRASSATNKTLYFGGPLHTQYLFMLTQTEFTRGVFPVRKDVFFAAGKEVTMRLRAENKRDKIRTFAGFISWGPDQLKDELAKGDWVLAPGDVTQLFAKDTSHLWKSLYNRWAGKWM